MKATADETRPRTRSGNRPITRRPSATAIGPTRSNLAMKAGRLDARGDRGLEDEEALTAARSPLAARPETRAGPLGSKIRGRGIRWLTFRS